MNDIKKIAHWCYNKDDPTIICPKCNKAIISGAIGILNNNKYHYDCISNKEYTYCLRCGRRLKNEKAKKIGYGVVCEKKIRNENNKSRRLF